MNRQLPAVYEIVDRLCNDSVAMASVFHFLQSYGGKISTDDWKLIKARFRANVLRHAESTAKLLETIDELRQPQ